HGLHAWVTVREIPSNHSRWGHLRGRAGAESRVTAPRARQHAPCGRCATVRAEVQRSVVSAGLLETPADAGAEAGEQVVDVLRAGPGRGTAVAGPVGVDRATAAGAVYRWAAGEASS